MTIKTRSAAKPAAKETKTLSRARKADAGKVADAKQQDIIDVAETPTAATAQPQGAACTGRVYRDGDLCGAGV